MKHFDEVTIQAFLDGEMPDERMAQATQHLSLCDFCTKALMEAEAEMADINFAFAAEASAPIPTQRIWARIENEIDFLETKTAAAKAGRKSFWESVAAVFTPAQIAFAGGLAAVILVSLFSLSVLQRQPALDGKQIADNVKSNIPNIKIEEPVFVPTPEIKDSAPPNITRAPRPIKVSHSNKIQSPKSKVQSPKSEKDFTQILPEEHDYLNSIAQLSKAVNSNDEFVMRPSFRVEYEKNLAVMNQAISAMQKQARRNPKDENAKRILFASYQNKIDLLNTVAEKSQLVASAR